MTPIPRLRMLVTACLVAAVGVFAACGDDEPETTTITEPAVTTATEPTTTSSTSSTSTSTGSGSTTTGEDVSGNCDEAEHANDPECSGGVGPNSGSGSGSGGSGRDHPEDD